MWIRTLAMPGSAIAGFPLRVSGNTLLRLSVLVLLAAMAAAVAAAEAGGSAAGPALKPGATAEERAKFLAECARVAGEPAPARALVGDPVRGASLPLGCFSCHGIERYLAPVTHATATFLDAVLRASGLSDLPPAERARFKGRITSLQGLREAVTRRNEYLNPKLTPQQIEDVVAYLNVTYYKFPQ